MSVGFEAELFLIDSSGNIKPAADEIIEAAKHSTIVHKPVKEYAKEVVEINAFPAEIVEAAVLDYINAFYELDELARKHELYLMPMAVYPGKYKPQRRGGENAYYMLKEKVFGAEKMEAAARATSFHFHYPMPDEKGRIVELYNFFVALVPFFDLVLQSSPFFQGRKRAKDTRAFIYRDSVLGEIEGAYRGFELFGGLASYVTGFDELINLLAERRRRWLGYANEYGVDLRGKELLDYYWGTVRLNKVGTIELRSPDINLPSYLLEAIHFFKKACDKATEERITIGFEELFKEEDGIVLPSMTAVRKASHEAALRGFESDYAYKYGKSLLDIVDKKGEFTLLRRMFEERKSFSDEVVREAEKKGYGEELSEEGWKEISLYVAERAVKEMDDVRRKATALFSHYSSDRRIGEGKLIKKILEYIGEEKGKGVDLSRKSPARLKQIKAIILSPSFKRSSKGIEKLSKEFLVIAFYPLKGAKHINVELKNDWGAVARGMVRLILEANGIRESEALYVAKKEEDLKLMESFGLSAAFHSSPKSVKEKADLLLHNVEEILKFTRGF